MRRVQHARLSQLHLQRILVTSRYFIHLPLLPARGYPDPCVHDRARQAMNHTVDNGLGHQVAR